MNQETLTGIKKVVMLNNGEDANSLIPLIQEECKISSKSASFYLKNMVEMKELNRVGENIYITENHLLITCPSCNSEYSTILKKCPNCRKSTDGYTGDRE